MLHLRSLLRVSAAVRYLVTLLGVLAVGLFAMAHWPQTANAATCTGSLQAKIDAAPSGGTVVASPCVYRQQVTITKPLTLKGQPGSEIRGSDVWTGWTYTDGYWRSKKTLPHFQQGAYDPVQCMPDTRRCRWPEQVFFNGNPLRQVGSDPGFGQFAVDSNRRVVLKADPRERFVEVTVRKHWILGKAANVTIEGFRMKHAANGAQVGAIMNSTGPGLPRYKNWTVRNNVLSDAHGAIVSLSDASGLKVLNNDIFRAGELGVHGSETQGELIRGNKLHRNNTEAFNWRGWEGGGIKLVGSQGLTVDSNRVYNNYGKGIWCDIDCNNVTISYNRVSHSNGMGIQYELSEYGKIFGNVVWENGWSRRELVYGAAIDVNNSRNVEVYRNTLAWNADGISIYGQQRDVAAYNNIYNIYVHDNTILAKDYASDPTRNYALVWFQYDSSQMFDPASNNRGANNRYWYPASESNLVRYEWDRTGYAKLANFNATPGEENGRYLTRSEKDAVVEKKNIPASPDPH